MRVIRIIFWLLFAVTLAAGLYACAPAAQAPNPAAEAEKQTEATAQPQAGEQATDSASNAAIPTTAPAAAAPQPEISSTAESPVIQATATQQIAAPTLGQAQSATQTAAPTLAEAVSPEGRILELEYPPQMRLGDSDVIRLSLIPSLDGYTVRTEFPNHQTDVQDIQTPQLPGYDLFGVARLEGVGFEIAPGGEQSLLLTPGEEASWHWSLQPRQSGQQRLVVRLLLRWQPQAGSTAALRESLVFSRGINVQVSSFFGLSRAQSLSGGMFGLLMGAAIVVFGLVYQPGFVRSALQLAEPNPALVIEPPAGLHLANEEANLLRTLFRRYGRLVLESEFLSGYSGARTFLARPLRPDGRADAHTIIKIGDVQAMGQEFINYERYVKDTLPPVTARIQQPPVSVRGSRLAAIQYTFIGTDNQRPTSLRQALLANPDPALLRRLFETFGPNWWMQRRSYTFRLAQEYDRVLPTHLVLEPLSAHGLGLGRQTLTPHSVPGELNLRVGDLVTLRDFNQIERRADGQSLSLQGDVPTGPSLRVRWMGLQNPNGAAGRVIATRRDLLTDWVKDFDLFGLPDPLAHLPAALKEPITGSQSTIHGDLNLENILVGPGGFVWLIDFAMTRDGHTLFDFCHLGASLVAHVIAPQMPSAEAYLQILNQRPFEGQSGDPLAGLLAELSQVARQCLFNPTQPREFYLALYVSCLGALKYANLQPFQKHLLYLTAAHLSQRYLFA